MCEVVVVSTLTSVIDLSGTYYFAMSYQRAPRQVLVTPVSLMQTLLCFAPTILRNVQEKGMGNKRRQKIERQIYDPFWDVVLRASVNGIPFLVRKM